MPRKRLFLAFGAFAVYGVFYDYTMANHGIGIKRKNATTYRRQLHSNL